MSSQANTVVISRLAGERISVSIPYDSGVIEYFRTIDQRHWCKDNRVWSFPAVNLDSIKDRLSSKYEIVIRENQPTVYVLCIKGCHAEITAEYDPIIMELINRIPGVKWDAMKRAHLIPEELVTAFTQALEEDHISFEIGKPPVQKKEYKYTRKSNTFDSQRHF